MTKKTSLKIKQGKMSKSYLILGWLVAGIGIWLGQGEAIASSPNSKLTNNNPPTITAQARPTPIPLPNESQVTKDEQLYLETAETSNIHLVLKLGERRVYVFDGENEIASYPVAVGKPGWETPAGSFEVIQAIENPQWQNPWTGEVMPAGPDTALGLRWIGFWTDGENAIGFHGTPTIESIGQAASHGCVRMRNEDVVALYEKVKIGTPVTVEP